MNKPSPGIVRLLTLVIFAVAAVFGGCSIWDKLAHPLPGFHTVFCVKIEERQAVANVDALFKALDKLGKDNYYIKVRPKSDGSADYSKGKNDLCCNTDKGHHDGAQPSSVNVTQIYRYVSGGGPETEQALKDIVKLLGQAK